MKLGQIFLKPMSVPIKYLFKRPFTVLYPFESLDRRETIEGKRGFGALDTPDAWTRWRGRPTLDAKNCTGCGICAKTCPNKTIKTVQIGERKYPSIDLARCMFCDLCAEYCPRKVLRLTADYHLVETEKSALIYDPVRLSGMSMEELSKPRERREKEADE